MAKKTNRPLCLASSLAVPPLSWPMPPAEGTKQTHESEVPESAQERIAHVPRPNVFRDGKRKSRTALTPSAPGSQHDLAKHSNLLRRHTLDEADQDHKDRPNAFSRRAGPIRLGRLQTYCARCQLALKRRRLDAPQPLVSVSLTAREFTHRCDQAVTAGWGKGERPRGLSAASQIRNAVSNANKAALTRNEFNFRLALLYRCFSFWKGARIFLAVF